MSSLYSFSKFNRIWIVKKCRHPRYSRCTDKKTGNQSNAALIRGLRVGVCSAVRFVSRFRLIRMMTNDVLRALSFTGNAFQTSPSLSGLWIACWLKGARRRSECWGTQRDLIHCILLRRWMETSSESEGIGLNLQKHTNILRDGSCCDKRATAVEMFFHVCLV